VVLENRNLKIKIPANNYVKLNAFRPRKYRKPVAVTVEKYFASKAEKDTENGINVELKMGDSSVFGEGEIVDMSRNLTPLYEFCGGDGAGKDNGYKIDQNFERVDDNNHVDGEATDNMHRIGQIYQNKIHVKWQRNEGDANNCDKDEKTPLSPLTPISNDTAYSLNSVAPEIEVPAWEPPLLSPSSGDSTISAVDEESTEYYESASSDSEAVGNGVLKKIARTLWGLFTPTVL
jgi:hypothetical protein